MAAEESGTTTHDSVPYCPYFHSVIELIGRRWTGTILKVLFDSPRSFGAIREEVPGLSDRLLTERLNELIEAGFVEKNPPDRSGIYRLTTKGHDLSPIFNEVENFAHRWVDTIQPA